MPTSWHRTKRITRRTLSYGILVLLIFCALLVSVANLLLPFIENNPAKVQQWLSEQVNQPVSFKTSKTEWTRRGPKISLTDLTVGKSDSLVRIGKADLLVSIYSGLFPDHPLTELTVKGLFLRLKQQPDDRWVLLGLPKQDSVGKDALDVLSGFGELQIANSVLVIQPKNKQEIRVPQVDLRLRVQGRMMSIGLRAQALKQDTPLLLVANLDRKAITGKIWIGGSNLHINHWLALFPSVQVPKIKSESELNIWVDLEQRRVMRVHSKLLVKELGLDEPKQHILDFSKSSIYQRIEAESFWQRSQTGWNWYLPMIRFVSNTGEETIRNVRIESTQSNWQATAEQIPLNPSSRLMLLLKAQWPDLSAWNQSAKVAGDLSGVRASGQRDLKQWSASGYGKQLGFSAVGNAPGMQDFSGVFNIDQQGGTFRFLKSKPVLDWPVSLGKPIPSTLAGQLVWWKSGPDWVLAARDLNWQGAGLNIMLDSQIQFYHSKNAPMLNLAARIAPFDFKTAKRFWLRNSMPDSSIRWLDMALVKGQIRDASIVMAGDLGRWPFTDKAGRFSARATILAEQFKFAADWPEAQNAKLFTDFNGPGFTAIGTASFLGNPIELKTSGIESFAKSDLKVNVHSSSKMQTLLPVLKSTPLKNTVGDLVVGLQGNGVVETDVQMFFPLSKEPEQNQIAGNIRFNKTDIKSPALNLAMQQVIGEAKFDNDGFSGNQLQAKMDNNPVVFGIRVGPNHVLNQANQVEANVKGDFNTDYLLKFDPSLSDLGTVLKGKSPWLFTVQVPISKNNAPAPVFLKAQSNLVGTELNLPIPLNKALLQSKAFELNTQLPSDQGSIEFKIGQEFRLLLNKPVNKPMSGIALFGIGTQGSIPASGFSVRGVTDEFDVPGWMMLAAKDAGDGGLQSFDLVVNHLRLLGSDFGSTRLLLSQQPNALMIRASGANFDGSMNIPNAKNAPIIGRFNKVYFKKSIPVPVIAMAKTAPIQPTIKPMDFPALDISIEDLRISNLPLGRAELLTIPTAQGMQISKLNTQSAFLSISTNGLWSGTGKQESVALKAQLQSPDLGKLMSNMHYENVINKGNANLKFNINWPGGPMDFNMKSITGFLDLEVTEGQLLSVDPGGGGRVLGLFSLAEIPRRLSLDFKDFFGKGFAFNKISGHFIFNQGSANTDNLIISAPAATINVSGQTDYVKQEFNQRVEVHPKTGVILPVIGALAAGPIGIVAGVVAQAVLKKPIGDTTTIHYQITGPWAKPIVKKSEPAKNTTNK